MNGFLLIIPFILVRFVLLGFKSKIALHRAAKFAPVEGKEKIAYIFYQLSNLVIIFFPLTLKVEINSKLFFIGIVVYILGFGILVISTLNFAKPEENGINLNGIYRFSRNPMYLGYYTCFFACAILTNSLVLLVAVIAFIISSHWIILSEERWCVDKFGKEYINYMNKARRYI